MISTFAPGASFRFLTPFSPARSQWLCVSVTLRSRCREPSPAISGHIGRAHRHRNRTATAATAAGICGGDLLETIQAEIAENTIGRQHVGDAAIGQIGERERTFGFQACKRFEFALMVQQQQAIRRQVRPAIVVRVERRAAPSRPPAAYRAARLHTCRAGGRDRERPHGRDTRPPDPRRWYRRSGRSAAASMALPFANGNAAVSSLKPASPLLRASAAFSPSRIRSRS